jgi:hypothetical protein
MNEKYLLHRNTETLKHRGTEPSAKLKLFEQRAQIRQSLGQGAENRFGL